jgi:hypothetical protein
VGNLTFRPGFLPYGSDDSAVIFRSPLTSLASITTPEVGSATWIGEVGSGTTYDSVLGMNTNGTGGIRLQGITGYALLDNEFHVQFEIETEYLAYNNPVNGTVGHVPSTTSSMYTINAATGGPMTLLQKTAGGALQSWINSTVYNDSYIDWILDTTTAVNVLVHSQKKERFSKVDIWKSGDLICIAVNDLVIAAAKSAGHTNANLFANQYIGSDRGLLTFMASYYIRNLQIATRAPMLQSHPKLAKIAVLSDSIWSTDGISSAYRDNIISHVMRAQFAKAGLKAGKCYIDVNGGYTGFTTGTNDLSSKVAALLLENPTIVCIQMGHNDVSQSLTIDAAWEADIKTNILDPIIALDSVEHIFIGTVTSFKARTAYDIPAYTDLRTLVNNYIKSWTAYSSKIVIDDRYTVLGAESPEDETFVGQLTGSYDDFHLAPIGHYKAGVHIGQLILTTI